MELEVDPDIEPLVEQLRDMGYEGLADELETDISPEQRSLIMGRDNPEDQPIQYWLADIANSLTRIADTHAKLAAFMTGEFIVKVRKPNVRGPRYIQVGLPDESTETDGPSQRSS